MIRTAIVGATGFTGLELTRLLLGHKQAEIVCMTTRQKKAILLNTLLPNIGKDSKLAITPYSFDEIKKKADVVFLCLPHTEAAQTGVKFHKAGKIVIDLSADFRLKNKADYEKWYGIKHKHADYLKKAVYGLPEYHKSTIAKADLIANPGCYPTSALLALLPLIQEKLVDLNSIVVHSASGVSGAGKKLSEATHFSSVDSNYKAYKVGSHQHTPEIQQELSLHAKKSVQIEFVTHLLPLQRGILTTIAVKRKPGVNAAKIAKAFKRAYAEKPFVKFLGEGVFPSLHDVQYTNFCNVGFGLNPKTGFITVISAIDNLVKGASGQAIQNMNICMGIPETEGLMS